jgi:hypothetical protein
VPLPLTPLHPLLLFAFYQLSCSTNNETKARKGTGEKSLFVLMLQHYRVAQEGVFLLTDKTQPNCLLLSPEKGLDKGVYTNQSCSFMQIKDCMGTNHVTVPHFTSHWQSLLQMKDCVCSSHRHWSRSPREVHTLWLGWKWLEFAETCDGKRSSTAICWDHDFRD